MQRIYKGKSKRSLPRVTFPGSFLLRPKEKHFTNTRESLKLLDEIDTAYVEKEHQNLLIIDVFSCQMAEPVIKKIQENSIKLVKVPPNMTNLFQTLDRTVNGAAKGLLKSKFNERCSSCIAEQLDEGKTIEMWKLS